MRKTREQTLISNIITAYCADYKRRKTAILERSYSRRVIMEYRYINSRLYDAAAEIVGSYYAERMIEEIGGSVGYTRSAIMNLSEVAYKKYKARIKLLMAKKLYLIDSVKKE